VVKINNIKIAYIGGGSMNWAWSVMGDLALEPQLSGEVRLYDTDHESAVANEKIANTITSEWKYKACTTLESTLTGADFVFVSILPGTFDEMESDVHLPEKYGIYQAVGDTTGPAGVLRSMRTAPMFAEIGLSIKEYCPNAWVINYTNPMAVCTNMMYQVFPQIKAIGCCHEAFHAQELLAKAYEVKHGSEIPRSDVSMNVLGVNHFAWVNEASYKTVDLMPLFEELAKKHKDSGFSLHGVTENDPANHFVNMNKVCFDLFLRYGALPVAGDRHLAEFMPPWYLANPETVREWGFRLTPVSWRKEKRKQLLAKRQRLLSGEEKFEPSSSGEEGTALIKALLGLSDMVVSVNLPNRGQIEGIPHGVIIETNAHIGRDSIRPVFAGRLPFAVQMQIVHHAAQQEMLVNACLNFDTDLAFNVFMADNLVNLSLEDGRKLFAEMFENTKAYLQGWEPL